MRNIWILLLIFAFLWYIGDHRGEVSLGPGIMAPEAPYQKDLAKAQTFRFKDMDIQPMAEFHVKAKVLSAKDYGFFDSMSELSPIDLGLGWGRMSDEKIVSQIDFRQSGRWMFWNAREVWPIPIEETEDSSSNMHMIPAEDYLADAMKSVRVGDIVEFTGYLVRVRGDRGEQWNSSLSREDKGNGACEIVFVSSFANLTEAIKS
jgi:hypothetical protein